MVFGGGMLLERAVGVPRELRRWVKNSIDEKVLSFMQVCNEMPTFERKSPVTVNYRQPGTGALFQISGIANLIECI